MNSTHQTCKHAWLWFWLCWFTIAVIWYVCIDGKMKFAFEEKNALKVNEEKKKNKNNNYLSLTAYCVAWNQEEWWIEWNHSQNRKLFFFYLFMGALKIGCFCDGCVFLINLNEHEKFSQMFQPQTKQLQISVMGSIHSKYYSIFFFIYFYLFALHTFLCVLVGYSAT